MDLHTASPALSLPDVIRDLRVAIAVWARRGGLSTVLAPFLQRMVEAVFGRLERLMIRFAAGRPMQREGNIRVDGERPGGDRPVLEKPTEQAARTWRTKFARMCEAAAYDAAASGDHHRLVPERAERGAPLIAAPKADCAGGSEPEDCNAGHETIAMDEGFGTYPALSIGGCDVMAVGFFLAVVTFLNLHGLIVPVS